MPLPITSGSIEYGWDPEIFKSDGWPPDPEPPAEPAPSSATVPETATLLLMAAGAAGLAAKRRRTSHLGAAPPAA